MSYNIGSRSTLTIKGEGRKRLLFALLIAASTTSPLFGEAKNPVPEILGHTPTQAAEGGTMPITIGGVNFIKTTVILVNGFAVPTTYQSTQAVIAQISVPAGSTASLAVQAQNPAPGGGTSNTLKIPVASLQLSATDPDGANTGTARLGVPVTINVVNSDTQYLSGNWSLQGVGKVAGSGYNDGSHNMDAVYTPPSVMPANPSVAITVSLQGLPALQTTYSLMLLNPVPIVTSTAPTQLLIGGTQAVALTGSGFVPGTTVFYNGTTLPITYVSYNQATVQVPVTAMATGNLIFQVQNPTPGGGAGTTFTESVAPVSITLTGTGQDGVNTNKAILYSAVAISAAVSGSLLTAVNWSLHGLGTISAQGIYTPPATMPDSDHEWATIYATLASNPAITASYGVKFIYPIPTLTAASPAIVPAGATTRVTLTGTGFSPITVAEVNGVALPTTYVSTTSLVVHLSPEADATGDLPIQIDTPRHSGGSSDILNVAVSAKTSLTAAARILDQTSFGPTTSLIQHVQQEGVTAWLTEQFNTPQSVIPALPAVKPSWCTMRDCFESEWWQTIVTGNDQLRQRVALALSEIFVVSSDVDSGYALQYYANALAQDAFTNWYTIMTDVTLSPAMGKYLNLLNSAEPTATLIANENFGRENMQLFNLGLNLLNPDGGLQLDTSGHPIPAYTEAQVEAFARVFTGWTYANADGSTPANLTWIENPTHPLVAVASQHDESSKTLLNGTIVPAGQTAEADLAAALTNIFQHPNVPPFVCRQLIQHLVKSNPSPGYVSRVAAVFTDDGAGVRGNMQAVLTAIFTDPEARVGDTAQQASDGHLREPILWTSAVMRGLGYVNIDPNNYWGLLSGHSGGLGEHPYQSPSVFDFFPPAYVIPGTTLNAPEFALENTGSVADLLTQANTLVFNQLGAFNVDLSATSPLGLVAHSQGPSALVAALNNLFLYGTMDPQTAQAITSEIGSVNDSAQQVRLAAYLVITSPEYKILH